MGQLRNIEEESRKKRVLSSEQKAKAIENLRKGRETSLHNRTAKAAAQEALKRHGVMFLLRTEVRDMCNVPEPRVRDLASPSQVQAGELRDVATALQVKAGALREWQLVRNASSGQGPAPCP